METLKINIEEEEIMNVMMMEHRLNGHIMMRAQNVMEVQS